MNYTEIIQAVLVALTGITTAYFGARKAKDRKLLPPRREENNLNEINSDSRRVLIECYDRMRGLREALSAVRVSVSWLDLKNETVSVALESTESDSASLFEQWQNVKVGSNYKSMISALVFQGKISVNTDDLPLGPLRDSHRQIGVWNSYNYLLHNDERKIAFVAVQFTTTQSMNEINDCVKAFVKEASPLIKQLINRGAL